MSPRPKVLLIPDSRGGNKSRVPDDLELLTELGVIDPFTGDPQDLPWCRSHESALDRHQVMIARHI